MASEARTQIESRLFLSGGGVLQGGPDWLLMRRLLTLTGKPDPLIYCISTADGDNLNTLVGWYETMNELPCRPRHLRCFGPAQELVVTEQKLLAADAIFVAGGNTMNMLAVWKAQGIDEILHKAWLNGVLIAGQSAGMICWFERGVTDSRGGLTTLDGLGWLKGSACPHYHTEPNRRPAYHSLIATGALEEGFACDNDAAILFVGTHASTVFSARADATAYRVSQKDGQVVDEPYPAELLTKNK